MTIKTNISNDEKQITVIVEGQFNFSLHQHFRDAYSKYSNQGAVFTVDLSRTDYMDSSALGMLLLLKDHATSVSGKLVIHKPNAAVAKILEIAKFQRLMEIEY